jgi:hypothetical protein
MIEQVSRPDVVFFPQLAGQVSLSIEDSFNANIDDNLALV